MSTAITDLFSSVPGTRNDWRIDWREDARQDWRRDWVQQMSNLSLPLNIALPIISGMPEVGYTLTISAGIWSGNPTPVLTFQWRRNGIDISGAMHNTYVLQAADIGTSISCAVTGTNSQGVVTVLSANSIGPIYSVPSTYAPINTSSPTVTGTPQVGETLNVADGGWDANPSPVFTYQWRRGAVNIVGETNNTYVVQSVDVGYYISAVVTATNSEGSETAVTNDVGPVIP